jgi:hypothetical protein
VQRFAVRHLFAEPAGRHGAIRRSTQMGSSTSSASTVGVAMPIASSHLVGNETCPHAAGCRQRIS